MAKITIFSPLTQRSTHRTECPWRLTPDLKKGRPPIYTTAGANQAAGCTRTQAQPPYGKNTLASDPFGPVAVWALGALASLALFVFAFFARWYQLTYQYPLQQPPHAAFFYGSPQSALTSRFRCRADCRADCRSGSRLLGRTQH